MAVNFKDFLADLPPERRGAIKAMSDQMMAEEVTLAELRKLLKKTQSGVARRMKVRQPQISRLERRPDILVSTLSDYVGAMGGSMRIVVSIPGHDDLRLHFGRKAARARAADAKGRRTAAGAARASKGVPKGHGNAGHEEVKPPGVRPKRAKA
jgi:hypothetical protein